MNRLKIILAMLILPMAVIAGNEDSDSIFYKCEAELSKIAKEISTIRFNENLADSLSSNLAAYFQEILDMEDAMDYPFDSLGAIGKVVSKNGKMRIFTWNTVRNNGTYTYYGLLQISLKDKVKTYRLVDKSDSIPNPERTLLNADNWYGALYYDIVETKIPDGTLYTLFGWDGNDLNTNKKVIESLTFSTSGRPKFGKSVFLIEKKKQRRVIFEYSRMATMMIQYDDDLDMIVYDHLSPSDQVYSGNAAYYGPDFSFDGLKFEDNIWKHQSNVPYKSTKANNSKKGKSKRKR